MKKRIMLGSKNEWIIWKLNSVLVEKSGAVRGAVRDAGIFGHLLWIYCLLHN